MSYITASNSFTLESITDIVGAMFVDTSTINFTFDDGTNTITADFIGSTSDVPEGSNLYFTDERAQDAVGGILTDTASINFTYDDAGNLITADVLPAGVDHGGLAGLADDDHTQYFMVTGRNNESLILSGTGVISNQLGSALLPSYSFTGDLNTGMYSSAADTLDFTVGGVAKWRIDSTGNLLATTTNTYNIGSSTNKPNTVHAGSGGFVLVPSNAYITASGNDLVLTGAAQAGVLTLATSRVTWNATGAFGVAIDAGAAGVTNNQFNSNFGLNGSTFLRPYGLYVGEHINVGSITTTLNGGMISATGTSAKPRSATVITSDANASTSIVLNNSTYTLRYIGVGDYVQLEGLATVAQVTAVTAGTLTVDTALGDGTTRNLIVVKSLATFADASNNIQVLIEPDGTTQIKKGLKISDAANGRMGRATLVAGTVTVSNTSVTADSNIFMSRQSSSTLAGEIYIDNIIAGTSFDIVSTSVTDDAEIAWMIVEPV